MNARKRTRLEANGWRVGSAAEFLDLSEEESAYVELKLTFGQNLEKRRPQRDFTQVELAKLLKSDPSRVAKMEAGDPSVSLDLLVKSFLVPGMTQKALAGMILRGR